MSDIFDRRILFEMTQRRVEADDYQDETSLEGEDDVESRDTIVRISDENRLAFLNDILGVKTSKRTANA